MLISEGILVASSGGKLDVQDHKIYNTGTGASRHQWSTAHRQTLLVDTASLKLTGGGDVTLANGGLITENAENPVIGRPRARSSVSTSTISTIPLRAAGTLASATIWRFKLNQVDATIDANVSGDTLTIDTGNTVINKGTLEVTGGGTLDVQDGKIDNTAGGFKGITIDDGTLLVDTASLES